MEHMYLFNPDQYGTWGQWSQWTPCSTTCGIGISTRSRVCPSYCIGNGVEEVDCSTVACPGII